MTSSFEWFEKFYQLQLGMCCMSLLHYFLITLKPKGVHSRKLTIAVLVGIGKLHAVFCGWILMSWYDIFEMLVSFFNVYIIYTYFECCFLFPIF